MNTGFARGNNLIIAEVRTSLVALLNPDAIPEPGWVRALIEAAERHPDVAMFGSTQISMLDPSRFDGVGDNYLAVGVPWRGGYGHPVDTVPPEYEVFSPCAAAAMYRTEMFRSVGGFDERFFCYVEDVDLGFRLRLIGSCCVQVATAVVHHADGASSATRNNDFARYYGTRNMIWTFVKNMPGPLFWLLLPGHVATLMFLTIRALLRGDAGATFQGIGAAFTDMAGIWSERCRIQSCRKVTVRAIANAMCWNPSTYLRRAPFIRL